jgi:hypothetical protein
MNKYLVLTSFFLIFSLVCVGFINAADDPCGPTITLVSQDPNPAVPNGYVKVIFEISDTEGCDGLSVRLDPDYPFSLDENATNVQTLQGNPYSQDYKNTWSVPYKVRIDPDALDGDYSLKLDYIEGVTEYFYSSYIKKGFNITIQDSRTNFDAVIQESTSSEVSIAIANIGKYTANSVVVRIPQQDSFAVSGTDGQMVGNLESGDYTIVGFSITQKAGSNTGNISPKLKFDVYYTDNLGERRISNMELPLNLGNTQIQASGNFPNRASQTTTHWYSSWITWLVVVVLLIISYILNKKYAFFSKKENSSKQQEPNWVKNHKEKGKK